MYVNWNLSLYCKFCPFDFVILHYVYRFLHAKFLIETNRILIGNQINRNILLAARNVMRCFHEPSADPTPCVCSVYSQIRYIKPITKIG